ncbi:MAG TPA: glutamate mutase L, partial [Micromonosporaceae bacterium]|nr:glutamate mutase L [Micromonosporaceae bacterium]
VQHLRRGRRHLRLAAARVRVPVVVAGNVEARAQALQVLAARGVPTIGSDNVLPRIGQLDPGPARAAVREVFLRHVIGGKRLSRGTRFAAMVRAPTPDAVLTAVELLADHTDGDLLVVDVGGATTDVYSALVPDDGQRSGGPSREVAGTLWRSRTVEGDLGVRWSAPGVVLAAAGERLLDPGEEPGLAAAAAARAGDPGLRCADPAVDLRLATLAATVALRRHARGEAVGPVRRGGRDLSQVRLVIGSGGVLRHAPPAAARAVLAAVVGDHAGGWAVPRAARVTVDVDYVLAPAGLLAVDHPRAALALLRGRVGGPW